MAGEIVIGAILSLLVAIFGGLVVWLIKGRMERAEQDIQRIYDKKQSDQTCQIIHRGVDLQIKNLGSRLDELLGGQKEISASQLVIANELVKLNAQIENRRKEDDKSLS